MINWHRLFGLALTDYFTGTAYEVELEKDVARRRQVLDVVVIRGEGTGVADPCDGLEGLCAHNLLTYKSGRESLDAWALDELVGHYVNYRKAFAAREPLSHFGLYAVCTRRPRWIDRHPAVHCAKPGVYRLSLLGRAITIIVLREVERCPRNALWELFSFEAGRVVQGARDYHWRLPDHVPILQEIAHYYRELGVAMPYTFQDFRRDLARELLAEFPPEEILRDLPAEERLRGLPAEERLRGLPPEERLQGLTDEELDRLRTLLAARKRQSEG